MAKTVATKKQDIRQQTIDETIWRLEHEWLLITKETIDN